MIYRVEESTPEEIPSVLAHDIKSLEYDHTMDEMSLFRLVLSRLFLESGFAPHPDFMTQIVKYSEFPAVKFRLQDDEAETDDPNRHYNISLTVMNVGSLWLVQGTFNHTKNSKAFTSSGLNPSNFVIDCQNPDFAKRFRRLGHLSRTFKDEVAFPLLIHAKITLGIIRGNGGLLSLPEEIIEKIFCHMTSPADIIRTNLACKTLKRIGEDGIWWKKLCQRDFKNQMNQLSDDEKNVLYGWKQRYKLWTEREKEAKKRTTALIVHPDFPPEPPELFFPAPGPRFPDFPGGGGPGLPRPRFDPPFGNGYGPGFGQGNGPFF